MKKEKSSIIVLSCSESSGDESEKAKPKIDREELRKYLQNSDENESVKKRPPKSQKNLSRKEKLLMVIVIVKINKLNKSKIQRNLSPKNQPKKYFLKGDDFKRLQKREKKLAPHLLIILKEKITNTWLKYNGKKIHFGSVNTEDFIIHKDPDRRDKYLTKAMKISKQRWPTYSSVTILSKLLVCQTFELKKKILKK